MVKGAVFHHLMTMTRPIIDHVRAYNQIKKSICDGLLGPCKNCGCIASSAYEGTAEYSPKFLSYALYCAFISVEQIDIDI